MGCFHEVHDFFHFRRKHFLLDGGSNAIIGFVGFSRKFFRHDGDVFVEAVQVIMEK